MAESGLVADPVPFDPEDPPDEDEAARRPEDEEEV